MIGDPLAVAFAGPDQMIKKTSCGPRYRGSHLSLILFLFQVLVTGSLHLVGGVLAVVAPDLGAGSGGTVP